MPSNIYIQNDVICPMRDGINLYADIYAQDRIAKNPVLICRTPYDKTRATYLNDAKKLANNGYTVVVQDVRGRFKSEGKFTWMWENRHLTGDENDGYDTIEWASKQ